jgi:hypothetical protein
MCAVWLTRRDITRCHRLGRRRDPVVIDTGTAPPRLSTLGLHGAHAVVMKRAHEQGSVKEHPAKLRRIATSDRLSKLSDELFVRILSFLPVPSLLLCQRYIVLPHWVLR